MSNGRLEPQQFLVQQHVSGNKENLVQALTFSHFLKEYLIGSISMFLYIWTGIFLLQFWEEALGPFRWGKEVQ